MRTSISFHRPPCTCTPLVVSLSRADATAPKQNLPTGSPQEGEGVRAWAWLIHSTTQVSFDLLSRPGVVKCRGAFLKFLSTSLTSLRPILGKCQGGCSDSANSERLKAARAQREYNCDICWHAAKPLQTSTTASNNFLTYHLAFISWSPGPVGGLRACHFNWRLSYLWPLDSQAAPVISILLFFNQKLYFSWNCLKKYNSAGALTPKHIITFIYKRIHPLVYCACLFQCRVRFTDTFCRVFTYLPKPNLNPVRDQL